MDINPGIYLEIIIYSVFVWMILSIMKMVIESVEEQKRIKELTKKNPEKKIESTRGEPLNLIGMIFILITVMVFINIKVGFELNGTPGDYPAIILAAVPGAVMLFVLIFNIIEYLRGIEKKRRWGLKSETNDLSERKKRIIDMQRKIFHFVAMGLLFIALVSMDHYLRSHIDGDADDELYRTQLENFWGSTNGLGYFDYIFVRASIPIGQSLMIFWMYGTVVVLMVFEITRLSNKVHFIFHREIQATLRYKEIDTFAAFTHFAVGYLFAAIILPPLLFLATMCLITFADPAASTIGMRFGKRRFPWNKKSLEGSLAGFIAAFISMLPFVGHIYALVGATTFVAIDLATPQPIKMSDNLLMPIMGTAVFVLLGTLGIPCYNLFGY